MQQHLEIPGNCASKRRDIVYPIAEPTEAAAIPIMRLRNDIMEISMGCGNDDVGIPYARWQHESGID